MTTTKIISWNIGHRLKPWEELLKSDADMAMLQEACQPPREIRERLALEKDGWTTEGFGYIRMWRTAIVRLSDRIQFYPIREKRLNEVKVGEFGVSRLGTISAADVITRAGETLTLISVYGLWEKPRVPVAGCTIYADAHVHRLISDLSWFITRKNHHKVIVAGDLNLLYGYGEFGREYWAGRYKTVFDRMEALGLPFAGPQSPNGRQADPWPTELPHASHNVPTFYPSQKDPATATRQLDYVFASAELIPRLQIRALNSVEEWGPSDHCKIEIKLD